MGNYYDDLCLGKFCENNIDDCASNPCSNGAMCHDQLNDYTCECVPPYFGRNCAELNNPCENNPCKNSATCTAKDDLTSYNCSCLKGFTGLCDSLSLYFIHFNNC